MLAIVCSEMFYSHRWLAVKIYSTHVRLLLQARINNHLLFISVQFTPNPVVDSEIPQLSEEVVARRPPSIFREAGGTKHPIKVGAAEVWSVGKPVGRSGRDVRRSAHIKIRWWHCQQPAVTATAAVTITVAVESSEASVIWNPHNRNIVPRLVQIIPRHVILHGRPLLVRMRALRWARNRHIIFEQVGSIQLERKSENIKGGGGERERDTHPSIHPSAPVSPTGHTPL